MARGGASLGSEQGETGLWSLALWPHEQQVLHEVREAGPGGPCILGAAHAVGQHDPRGAVKIPLRPVERPLIERAWIRANIARLEHRATRLESDAEKDDLERKIIDLSTRHRVLSDDPGLTAARLGLALAVRIVLRRGLALLGLSSPERM